MSVTCLCDYCILGRTGYNLASYSDTGIHLVWENNYFPSTGRNFKVIIISYKAKMSVTLLCDYCILGRCVSIRASYTCMGTHLVRQKHVKLELLN